MYTIREASLDRDLPAVRRLWFDHLGSSRTLLAERYDIHLPVEVAVEHDIETIQKFQPPSGRILLAETSAGPIGTGSFRMIRAGVAEIKRMYVDPAHRGEGVGRLLLAALVRSAKDAGYRSMKLETAPYRAPAIALYKSVGFVESEPYPETEIPREYWGRWLFMELPAL